MVVEKRMQENTNHIKENETYENKSFSSGDNQPRSSTPRGTFKRKDLGAPFMKNKDGIRDAASEESSGDRPRPSYGGDRPRPSYGGDRPRPSYGGDRPRPSYGGDRPRPSYGGDRLRPSYGGDRPFVVRPALLNVEHLAELKELINKLTSEVKAITRILKPQTRKDLLSQLDTVVSDCTEAGDSPEQSSSDEGKQDN